MNNPLKTWLIVGASRGIGLEFTRQLLGSENRVFATARDPFTADALDDVVYDVEDDKEGHDSEVLACDISCEESIKGLVNGLIQREIKNIDYVVINAGVLNYPNRATELSFDNFAHHLHTNTIGPIITAQLLLKSGIAIGTIAFMSSDSGSTTRFRDFEDGFAAYAASKAALNQALRHMAAELKWKNSTTTILALHPGEVETDMAADAEVTWEIEAEILTPEQSVRALIPVIMGKELKHSGTFWTWEDKQYPW